MKGREYTVRSTDVLRVAEASGCSAYDCEFVSVAMALGVRLVTADRQVLRAFPSSTLQWKSSASRIPNSNSMNRRLRPRSILC